MASKKKHQQRSQKTNKKKEINRRAGWVAMAGPQKSSQ